MNRRQFIGGVAAFGASRAFGVPPQAERIARVGLMTDTHVGKTLASCSRVRQALSLFKAWGAEMVVNCGDIADRYYPDGYRFYRQTVESVYPDEATRPRMVFVYANHDLIDHDRHNGGKRDMVWAFENVRKLLGAQDPITCDFVWKGLPFVVCSQDTGAKGFPSWEDFERTVGRLCAENPGKPVFVCDHLPPAGTTFHSWHWGSERCRAILNRIPQVVSISGHVHGSLASERQIWQGEFTAVNVGCLQTWGGFAPGSTPPTQSKQNFGVLVMDVYRDRLVFYRCDVRDGSQCAAPWVVPLPFAANSAPYAPKAAAARADVLPAFLPSASVVVKPVGEGGDIGYAVEFPEAKEGPDAFMYRISCERRGEDGKWVPFTRDDVFGEFWKARSDRTGKARYVLSTGYFVSGEKYRVKVAPLDFFYREAKAISCEFAAAHKAGETIWKGDRVMDEVRFTEHGKPVAKGADGFFRPPSGQGTMWLPSEAFKGIVAGRRYQLVLDLELEQSDEDYHAWRLRLVPSEDPDKRWAALAEAQTANGRPGVLRYVMAFTPPKGKPIPESYNVVFQYRGAGAIRVASAALVSV